MEYIAASDEPSPPACSGLECATVPLQPEDDNTIVPAATPATAIEQELPPTLAVQRVEPLDDAPACISETRGLALPVLAVYLMLDSSGSMEEPAGTRTKWDSVRRAIRGFLVDTQGDERLLLGMQFFPLLKPGTSFLCDDHDDCGTEGGLCFKSTCRMGTTIQVCRTDADCPGGAQVNPCVDFGLCSGSDPDAQLACLLGSAGSCGAGQGQCEDFQHTCTDATSCDPQRYGTPAVEIQPISMATAAIDQALTSKLPEGLTPTVPALQGSLQHAREWALTHPDQTVVTVLATDGLPTECGVQEQTGGTETINEVLGIARGGVSGDPPIRTFVIGVFQPGEAGSINNVNAIAQAGGTAIQLCPELCDNIRPPSMAGLRLQIGCSSALE